MKQTKWFLSVGILCAILSGCGTSQTKDVCSQVAWGSHAAVTPQPRGDDWWKQRHQQILEQVHQKQPTVIFIGDSITHGWENKGKAVWEKYYSQYDALNLGFSGDRTEHVLWRLENGEIDGISPKAAVLMIGTNNASREQYTPEQIADGIQAIVCTLRTRLPQTKILILAIFPRGSDEQRRNKTQDAAYNPLWAKNDQVNRIISELADGRMIYYLNINQAFLNEQGVLTRRIMPDLLHPEEEGYRLWAEAMNPVLEQLLK